MKLNIVSILILILFSSCTRKQEVDLTSKEIDLELLNQFYGSGDQQKFDLFLPENRTTDNTKLLIIIHGGGWTSGDKDELKFIYDHFKRLGKDFAIANMNYTLADLNTKPIPLQTNDIKRFLNFIRSKQEEYKISSKFILFGTSAGAHLSMMYGYKFDMEKEIAGIVNVVGPTNFIHSSYTESSDLETIILLNNIETLHGETIDNNPSFFETISPVFYLTKESPPTISFYGGNDFLVPEQQGELLHAVLKEQNIVNELYIYPNEGHGWGDPNIRDTFSKIEIFIKKL